MSRRPIQLDATLHADIRPGGLRAGFETDQFACAPVPYNSKADR